MKSGVERIAEAERIFGPQDEEEEDECPDCGGSGRVFNASLGPDSDWEICRCVAIDGDDDYEIEPSGVGRP